MCAGVCIFGWSKLADEERSETPTPHSPTQGFPSKSLFSSCMCFWEVEQNGWKNFNFHYLNLIMYVHFLCSLLSGGWLDAHFPPPLTRPTPPRVLSFELRFRNSISMLCMSLVVLISCSVKSSLKKRPNPINSHRSYVHILHSACVCSWHVHELFQDRFHAWQGVLIHVFRNFSLNCLFDDYKMLVLWDCMEMEKNCTSGQGLKIF